MIKLKFKNREKEIEFFESIERYNYLDDADIVWAIIVSDTDEENNLGTGLFMEKGKDIEV